ncbi:MAG: glucose-1-phosphate cytidylyltransferase [Candidatus Competibacter sp.]|jgi:glucose-1-phosphate cytidylyltransferase
MKAVILAGGLGTRLSEETVLKPKPMVEIGGRPILWHIMKIYSAHGINEFVVCCGYKGYLIKEYFANYFLYMSDVTFDMANNRMEVHVKHAEPWRVTLVDTGQETMTGGRVRRIRDYLDNQTFCLTYGDGVSDVDIGALLAFHRRQETLVTVSGVQPSGRYGVLEVEQERVMAFQEKPTGNGIWVSGGFFVVEPRALDYIESDASIWEREPLDRIAAEGQLAIFKHGGFWAAMDTLRDKYHLEQLWANGRAPWKVWD